MINKLDIKLFKSIRSLHLECRRINLFIGEPNVGKSNILEALGVLSWLAGYGKSLQQFVRYQSPHNIFYDGLTEEPVEISFEGEPTGKIVLKADERDFKFSIASESISTTLATLSNGGGSGLNRQTTSLKPIRYYKYRQLNEYDSSSTGPLAPPYGNNLFTTVFGSRELRDWMANLYVSYGHQLVMKPAEKVFELQKQQDGIVISYPYSMSSDTLRRMLFHYTAMVSNKDAILVFEEPEANTFPFYTKQLGEDIAFNGNQFFIATHNPYLLEAILEKTPKNEVAVHATYYRDFTTQTKLLSDDEINFLLDADPFLGLEQLIEV